MKEKVLNFLKVYKGAILFALSIYICMFALSENNKRIDNQHLQTTIQENN